MSEEIKRGKIRKGMGKHNTPFARPHEGWLRKSSETPPMSEEEKARLRAETEQAIKAGKLTRHYPDGSIMSD